MYNNQQANKPAYQHKPGRGSFFSNNKASKPNDPNFTGSAKLEDGTDVWVSVWVDRDQNGYPKQNGQHSISIRKKDAAPSQGRYPQPNYQQPQQAQGGYQQPQQAPQQAQGGFKSDEIPW